jgi:hypothetical protein
MTSITGLCPTCGANRNAQVISEHERILEPTLDPFDPTLRGESYRILKCGGCDTIYFQRELLEILPYSWDEESDTTTFSGLKDYIFESKEDEPERIFQETICWPAPPSVKGERPDWGKLPDEILIKLLNSVYTALDNDLRVLAAIGMRVVFERASELIGVDPEAGFARKLDQLNKDGHIGAADKENLEVLTNAGSAAAHRGWEPNPEELHILVSIMEHFVSRFILKEEAGKLKQSIPPRTKQRTPNNGDRSAQLIEFPPQPTKAQDGA